MSDDTGAVGRLRARCRALGLPVVEEELPALAFLYDFYAEGLVRISRLNADERAPITPPPTPPAPASTAALQRLADAGAPWLTREPSESLANARRLQAEIETNGTGENA